MADLDSYPPLVDRIRPGVRVLFVGINPGVRSAVSGHHFAGFSNRFWKLLSESKLVPEPLTFEDDGRLPDSASASPTSCREPRRASARWRRPSTWRDACGCGAKCCATSRTLLPWSASPCSGRCFPSGKTSSGSGHNVNRSATRGVCFTQSQRAEREFYVCGNAGGVSRLAAAVQSLEVGAIGGTALGAPDRGDVLRRGAGSRKHLQARGLEVRHILAVAYRGTVGGCRYGPGFQPGG